MPPPVLIENERLGSEKSRFNRPLQSAVPLLHFQISHTSPEKIYLVKNLVEKGSFSYEACLYGEGRPRLDLEYPVYGTHELADKGALNSVVVLIVSFPFGFGQGRDLNPQPSFQDW